MNLCLVVIDDYPEGVYLNINAVIRFNAVTNEGESHLLTLLLSIVGHCPQLSLLNKYSERLLTSTGWVSLNLDDCC